MLVKAAPYRWSRDPEVSDLIEHLDAHLGKYRKQNLSYEENEAVARAALTAPELRAIVRECELCQNDFSYAARNYFWIEDKETRRDILFRLWPSQELVLQSINEIKARGVSQRILTIKARQLGISTVVEGLGAWRTIFFTNINGLIISHDPSHAAYLFGITQKIYDRLPWWLKPRCSSREFKTGLILDNPDYQGRYDDPGLNSKIIAMGANATTASAQGRRLNWSHLCLSPGSLIIVGNGRVKPIVELTANDIVLTSSGRVANVKVLHKSVRTNEMTCELKLYGNPMPLSTTRDHLILTPEGFKPASSITNGDFVRFPVRPITNGLRKLSYVCRGSGGARIYLTERTLPANFDTGYMFGLYLAEGSLTTNKNNKVQWGEGRENNVSATTFTIHRKEEDKFTDRLKRALGAETHIGLNRRKSCLTSVLSIYNVGLARFIGNQFGAVDEKRIPDWAWDCGEDFCRGLVCGYFDGDGHVASDSIRATSIRLPILIAMRGLIASLGYGWSSLTFRESGFHYGRNCQAAWTLHVCGPAANELSALLGRELHRAKAYHWRYSEDQKYIDIEVETNQDGFSTEFYDIEVDAEEHNFCTIQCCVHNSETASWPEDNAREVIEEDVVNALSDGPETFAVIETTAKGAGTYMHWKWLEAVRLGDKSEWRPLFFPWFFDASHKISIQPGWTPVEEERQIRTQAEKDWLRCDFDQCRQYHFRKWAGRNRDGEQCPTCSRGILRPHVIPDEQLAWMERKRENAQGDEESLKKLKQEQASTAIDAFVSSGIEVFSQKALAWAQMTVDDPIAEGFLDSNLRFHGFNPENGRCYLDGCEADHRHDDKALRIWEFPVLGIEYNIGADVSQGLGGKEDYSAASVFRVDRRGGPDVQVATWARNDIDAISYATILNKLGNYFGQCQLAPEMNLAVTANTLQMQLAYPRLYQMKSMTNSSLVTQRLGWLTNRNSKPSLYHTMRKKLEDRTVVLRDRFTVEELKTFKALDETKTGAAHGFKDDRAMAAMIGLLTAHDSDWDEDSQTFVEKIPLSLDNAPWIFRCFACDTRWPAREASDYRHCPKCRNMNITAEQNMAIRPNLIGSEMTDSVMAQFAEDVNQRILDENNTESYREYWGDHWGGSANPDQISSGVPDYDSL